MTNRQRARIYHSAAIHIGDILRKAQGDMRYAFCCNIIRYVSGIDCTPDEFPEFFLIKNKRRGSWAWWDYRGFELEPRILALLLSEQMALNP